ncbi:MAG: FMN-binding protein [Lachnospiraceae bacterium]|nr:FMN-binding protein [Lachnospiraceae bacterium]
MTEEKQVNQTALLIKNALILFAITLVAGVLLGIVYELTKGEISRQEAQAIVEANQAVFSGIDNFNKIYDAKEAIDPARDEQIAAAWSELQSSDAAFAKVKLQSVSEALDVSGNLAGYVINVASSGYSSDVTFSIGMTMEGHLNGISIISIAESPGLGMEAEPVLVPQFVNATAEGVAQGRDDMPFSLIKNTDPGIGQIRAITAATITSNAITNGVNAGVAFFNNTLKGAL